MFREWQVEKYDHQAFVKQSIENVIRSLVSQPWITDFQTLNPCRVIETVNDSKKQQVEAMQAQAAEEFKEPLTWSPF